MIGIILLVALIFFIRYLRKKTEMDQYYCRNCSGFMRYPRVKKDD